MLEMINETANAVNQTANATKGALDPLLGSLELGPLTDGLYFGNTLLQYLVFSIIVVSSFAFGKLIYLILKHKIEAMTAKTNTRLDDIIIKTIQGPLVFALVLIGLQFGLDVLTIPADIVGFIDTVLSVIVSLAILWFIVRIVDIFIEEYLQPLTKKTQTELDEQIIPVIKKTINALLIIFGIVTIAGNFGYDITAVITGLGIGGIAVALAAKDTLGNMFGGVSIFVDRPFKIGDRVKINNDTYGDVVDVGLRSSKIKNLDNNIIVIPNSVLSNAIVENYARPSHKLKQSFNVGLVYGTKADKIEKAVELIKDSINGVEGVTDDEPLVWFTKFEDSSLNLYCIYWIKSLKYWGTTKHEINLNILKSFEKAGLEMAYPTQTIFLEKDGE